MKNEIHVLENKVNHRQMQGIIITTEGGKVIAIDGGRGENADYMIEYLKEITGQAIPVVDAWFLTHAHNDHLPAFYEIVQNRSSEVVVGTVFYNLPSIQYYTRIPGEEDEDGAITTKTFFDILPLIADRVCVASGGDTYEIGDAKFEILYSAETDIEVNICNNASRKGIQFPLRDPSTRDIANKDISKEDPLIINPAQDTPQEHIRFNKYIAFAVSKDGVESDKGRCTIDVFDLNGKAENKPNKLLVEARRRKWQQAELLYKELTSLGKSRDDTIKFIISFMGKDEDEYAGMFQNQELWP